MSSLVYILYECICLNGLNVSMYGCAYIHMHTCTYVDMHTCARMCEKNAKNIHLCVHVCMQMRYLFVCAYMCGSVNVNTCNILMMLVC